MSDSIKKYEELKEDDKFDNFPEKEPKLDLKTLEYIKFTFDLYSDWSSRCLGYQRLCEMITERGGVIKN